MRENKSPTMFASAMLTLVIGVSVAACKKDKASAHNGTYTARALVEALPTKQHNEILLNHEAIPNFVTSQGKTQDMVSMSMPFGIADGVSLAGIAVGDAVELTFDTDWSETPVTRVTAIAKLPADSKLKVTRPKMPDPDRGGGRAGGDNPEGGEREGDHREGEHRGGGGGGGGGDGSGGGGDGDGSGGHGGDQDGDDGD